MSRYFLPIAALALAAAPLATAQSPKPSALVLTITGVPSSDGFIRASLCDDPAAAFPGVCRTYSAEAPAQAGATTITFESVAPGRYALQFWHDANADTQLQIPPEGYGFGNDAAWPPSFDGAAIDVTGDATIKLQLQDVLSQLGNAYPPNGAATAEGIERVNYRGFDHVGQLDSWSKSLTVFDAARKGSRQ